jgi:hypothetical protein
MANAEVFNTGYQQGLQRGGEARARKQALSDEEFVSKAHELAQNRLDLQSKLPTLLDEKGQPTPQYQETMKALQQNVEDMRELYHPQKSPGAIQKFGHILTDALHITKPTPTATMVIPNPKGLVEAGNIQIWDRPSVQNPDGTYSSEYSTSFQDDKGHEVLVPTVVNGKFLTPDGKKPPEGSDAEKAMFKAAWDHYLKTGENLGKFASAEEADAYATRLHNRGKIPKNIAKQETQQAANTAADQHTAQGIAAAAPPSPAQAATTAAGAKNVGDLAIIQGKMKNLKTLFPDAPPELQRKWFEELAQSITGIKAGQEKYFSSLATTKDPQGNEHYWRVPMAADQEPEEVDFDGQKMVPKAATGKESNADEQRDSYRLSHNIPPGQKLDWKQELDFQKQLALGRSPFGAAHLGIAEKNLALREQEDGFKDFLALQKQLTPLQRVVSTAGDAIDYVTHPSGPGDVALTLAFFDAIKTTGVRFTKQEQDFITGSRGFMDGAQAKFDQGFMGTVFSPEQRALIAQIVKKGGEVASKQQGTLLGGASNFVPKVAAAAGGGATPPAPLTGKGIPPGATHIKAYQGHHYYIDDQGNNLGQKD